MRTLASLITFALIFTGVLLVGCVGDLDSNSDVVAEEDPSANIPPETSLTLDHIPQGFGEDTPNPTETEDQVHRVIYGYTYHRSDGNRFVVGKGALPGVEPLDIHLLGRPLWVVAAPGDGGSIWVVVLEGGNVQAFSISEGGYEEISITPASMPPGLPPLLKVEGSAPMLVTPPEDASPLTHPVIVGQTGEWTAYVARNGDLVISDGEEYTRFPVNALPDARILVDETDRLLLLTDATRRYDHGVLGDDLEAGSVTLVETDPKPRVVLRITVSEPGVIEGIAPVWADLDSDVKREIVVTRSDRSGGAQILVFDESGREIAASPSIGRGYRWRNLLGAAPFGPAGGLELVDVLTPHLTGVVQFYALLEPDLKINASIEGFTSHVIGTRNLDMALAGDFDGDNRIEVLLPDQSRRMLASIRRTADGAGLAWRVPLGGVLTTNLAAVALPGGELVVGAGREDSVLRVWMP